jgi:DNA-binding NtrC family response regulator
MTDAKQFRATLIAIDDDPSSLDLVKSALKSQPLDILTATDPCTGLDLVICKRPEIVLLDLCMPKMSGMDLLEKIQQFAPEIEVILITAHYSTESAVEAIRKGASDYLEKPISIPVLRQRLGRIIEQAQRRQAALKLDDELVRTQQFQGMVGRSPAMLQVFARISRIAPHFRTVLISGATGTGKELAAAALHRLSPAASGPFAVCNCSAVVETLFESELFGHVKGAFTGATQDKVGLIESADGGTLFLDEIGDMPLETQTKLLRVIENREIQRVGSTSIRKINIRVVAATNRDLLDLIAQNLFREDLYYRLSTIEVRLPSLKDRMEDLVLLQRYFIEQFAAQFGKVIRRITQRAQLVLSHHSWPGNVRELRSALESACMTMEGDTIDVPDLPEYLRYPRSPASPNTEFEPLPLAEIQRRHVLQVLEQAKGNKVKAAKILGINRATIYRILNEDAVYDVPAPGRPH